MTTCADVDAAWLDKIWNHSDIQAITDAIINYDVIEDSEKEIAQLYSKQKLNFIQYLVTRAISTQSISGGTTAQQIFQMQIRFARQKDVSGEAYIAVRDFFDTLISLVSSELGTDWNGTVDFYTMPEAAPDISEATIANVRCWLGTYRFSGLITQAL